MAKYWTLLQLKTKIKQDTDIEAEDFIQSTELTDLINEGIDEIEKEIHKLGLEDNYFLTFENRAMTQGVDEFPFPDDIYAHKIKGITFTNGDLIYPVKRIRGEEVYEIISNVEHFTNTGDFYKWLQINDNSDSGATPKPVIKLYPTVRDTIAQNSKGPLRIWYLRNANLLSADADICDLPECAHFIIRFVKYWIYFKEGHPLMQEAKAEMEQERQSMIQTLATMIPDNDTRIVPELDAYNEAT